MHTASRVALMSLVMVTLSGGAVAQTPASKPGPGHKKLVDLWVGDWTYEGQSYATPLGSGGRSSGEVTVRPSLGGFYVEWRGEDKGPTGTALCLRSMATTR